MSKNVIVEELDFVRNTLSYSDYPETLDAINSCCYEDGYVFENMELADELCDSDITKIMPECVKDLIIALYKIEIKNGNADAMCNLGAMYYTGRYGEPDYKKAIHYYEMAAENGNVQAYENLGYCYYYGRSVEVDYEKAFRYYSVNGFLGVVSSLYKIGDMYKNGLYVEKNLTEAFRIYDCCAKSLNEDNAQCCAGPVFLRLGDCFFKGEGTKIDLKLAMHCYQQAESYLYDMVNNGEHHYKRSLGLAIKGQALVRSQLAKDLPGFEWTE